MTATERLRQLLDERGVEWDRYEFESVTFWNDETNLAVASDDREGMLWVSQRITPEQAIEATLGRGTCEDDLREALADLWPRASFTMCPENRVSWLERLAELGVEVSE